MQIRNLSMTRLLLILAIAGLAKGVVGCETTQIHSTLESEVVVQTTQERLSTMGTAVDGATDWVEESSFTADVFRVMGLGEDTLSTGDPIFPVDPGTLSADLAELLQTQVLLPSNVVDADEHSVTYGVNPADFLCTNTASPGQPGTQALLAYTQCRILYSSVPVYVRAEMLEAGMDLTLVVGRASWEPLTLELGDGRVAARVDLAEAREAAMIFVDLMPEEQHAAWPTVNSLAGEVVLSIDVLGPQKASATLEVTQPIAAELEDDGAALTMDIAPGVATLLANGEARVLTLDASLGAVDVLAPHGWDINYGVEVNCGPTDLACTPAMRVVRTDGALGLFVSGLTGQARVEETTELVEILGLGLGPETSRLTLDGADVYVLDVNPADGRTLDLSLSRSEGSVLVEAAPLLDLSLGIFAENAVDIFGAAAQSWMANEVLELSMDEDIRPAVRIGLPGVRVERGVLSLGSQSQPGLDKTLEEGQCLQFVPVGSGHGVEPNAFHGPAHPFQGLSIANCGDLW